MKFRYKVLLINLILLSIGIGIVGYFMIRKNFRLAFDAQTKMAIEENNLLQATLEYRMLEILNSDSSGFVYQIKDLSADVMGKLGGNNEGVYIIYNGELLVSTDEKGDIAACPEALFEAGIIGKKHYMVTEEEGSHYLYTCATSLIQEKTMNIINRRDVTEVYTLVEQQRRYFAILLLIVVSVSAFAMFIISYLLTKPLEKLKHASERFGQGDYESRVSIQSSDEVGALAGTFNQMADSVCDHMEELQGMVRRQEQFVADFTHEIKTPMTAIIGYADTIRSKELSRENQIMAASYIFHEGKRLEDMSMKLFDFIYTKQRTLDVQPVSVRRLLEEVKESVEPMLEGKEQTLECVTVDGEISGEISLLKSAFINLIDNARKASKKGATIRFVGEKTEDGICIFVQDFGVGISEEHLKRICDEFYMVDKSRSRSEGGAGLGLSLASLIFECHHAKLTIESRLGVGTTMRVEFYEKQED